MVPNNDNDPVFTTKHIFYSTCGSSTEELIQELCFYSLHFRLVRLLRNLNTLHPACGHKRTLESILCYRFNGRSYYDEWDSLSEWRIDWLFSDIEINNLSTNSTPANASPSHPPPTYLSVHMHLFQLHYYHSRCSSVNLGGIKCILIAFMLVSRASGRD